MTTAAAGTVIMAVIETGTGTVTATTATEIATETTALAMIAPHTSTSSRLYQPAAHLVAAVGFFSAHPDASASCAFPPRRGILNPEDSSRRMLLRVRSAFLVLIILVANVGSSAWGQAPPANKKPPSPTAAAAPPAPQSKHYPILLLASGNNPAWSLRIGQKGAERLDRPGYPPINLEAAEVTHVPAGDAWTYHAKDMGTRTAIAIHLSPEACSTGTSATKYPSPTLV